MDKIIMQKVAFFGYHGVLPEETTLGQQFMIDLELGLDLRAAGTDDDLEQTINYAEVYQLLKQIVEGKPFKLIEALAEQVASSLLSTYTRLQEVKVSVIKPNPPFAIHFQGVAVHIVRTRNVQL